MKTILHPGHSVSLHNQIPEIYELGKKKKSITKAKTLLLIYMYSYVYIFKSGCPYEITCLVFHEQNS